MATRSNIGARQQDGTIKAIYCHWDGDTEGVGAVLEVHYKDLAKVERLLAVGNIPSLDREQPEELETFAQRGEGGNEAQIYKDETEWIEVAQSGWLEYLYLFENGEWRWFSLSQVWHKLPNQLCISGGDGMNRDEYLSITDAIQCLKEEEDFEQGTMNRFIDALVEPLSKHYQDFNYVQYLNDTEVERERV